MNKKDLILIVTTGVFLAGSGLCKDDPEYSRYLSTLTNNPYSSKKVYAQDYVLVDTQKGAKRTKKNGGKKIVIVDKSKKQKESPQILDIEKLYNVEMISSSELSNKQKAFLDMVAFSEGTYTYHYNTHFGNIGLGNIDTKFPCKRIKLEGSKYTSSACGKYQIIDTTWEGVSRTLGLRGFSKQNQDIAAHFLLKDMGIDILIEENKIEQAINKSSKIWASLPSKSGKSFYGQNHNNMEVLKEAYNKRLQMYSHNICQL